MNIITTIAGNGTGGFSGDNGPATNAQFNGPEILCIDNHGDMYIADRFNNRIRKISSTTNTITTIAGTGIASYFGDNLPATSAQLFNPQAVITDTGRNIYLGDGQNWRVRKINAITGIITTIVGTGTAGSLGDGGPATNAQIREISGLCFDRVGNLYIADWMNYKIRKIDPTGIITTYAGTTSGYSGDHGPATNAKIQATSVFADSLNNIYIADEYNNAVRRIDNVTGIITTIAGTGVAGYLGDNGPATSALLNTPRNIYVDKRQNIFIADYNNNVIRKIDALTNIITTVAGNGTAGYSGNNGPATNAQLMCTGVFFDDSGSMYIADYGNSAIRKVYYCPGNPVAALTNTGSGATHGYTYTGTNILTDSVRWDFGDGGTSTAMNPVHTYTANGTYHCCVTVYSYCGSDSACKDVTIQHVEAPLAPPRGKLVIWPNPVSKSLTLTLSQGEGSVVRMYDVVGHSVALPEMIGTGTMTMRSDKEVIDVSGLPGGIYLVEIVDNDTGERTVRKIIKE